VLAELRRFAGADRFDDDVTIVIMKVPRGEARA
jgi:serine phosphatase RsbU (regulator of sigma subunit)